MTAVCSRKRSIPPAASKASPSIASTRSTTVAAVWLAATTETSGWLREGEYTVR